MSFQADSTNILNSVMSMLRSVSMVEHFCQTNGTIIIQAKIDTVDSTVAVCAPI